MVSLLEDEDGITPWRLPQASRPYLPPLMSFVASCAAGVRVALVTDTTALAIELAQISVAPIPGLEHFPPRFDLVVDDELVESVVDETGSRFDALLGRITEAGPETTVRFEGLPLRRKRVEVWLPVRSRVAIRRIGIDEGASCEAWVDERPKWIVHGSSITHCGEAYSPSRTWPGVAARALGLNATNLGLGGQCLVEQWVARAIRDLPASQITLKLGINVWNFAAMSDRVFTSSVHGFLDTVRDGHPTTPIDLVSPIYCPPGEHTCGPSVLGEEGRWLSVANAGEADGCPTVTRMREVLAEIVAVRIRNGDEWITYVDGLELLGPDDRRHLPDDLHPDADGYVAIGERYARMIRRRL